MMRTLLLVVVLAALGNVPLQALLHDRAYAEGFPPHNSSPNSEPQKQSTQSGDLRVEHADVPTYPTIARTARISGKVEVRVTVKDGNVISTEVKSGPPILARTTVANIQSWRFYPLVNATFTTTFIYELNSVQPLDPQNPKVELQLPLFVKITTLPALLDSK